MTKKYVVRLIGYTEDVIDFTSTELNQTEVNEVVHCYQQIAGGNEGTLMLQGYKGDKAVISSYILRQMALCVQEVDEEDDE